MTFEAAIVLFLGIIFLVWGLKTRAKPDKNILAALKNMVTVKEEIKTLREDVEQIKRQIIRTRQQSEKQAGENRYQAPEIPGREAGTYSQRYHDILYLASQGCSTREIADRLSLGRDAVDMVLNTYRRDTK